MRGVEHHQPRQFAGCGGGDDLAAEAAFVEQRHTTAMIEMGVSQHQDVDRPRVESERLGVLVVEVAAALEEAAIDQDAFAGGLNQMA